MTYNCQLREKAVEEPKEAKEEANWFSAAPVAHWFQLIKQRRFRDQSHWLSLLLLESFDKEAHTYLDTSKPNTIAFRALFTAALSRCGLEKSGEGPGDALDITKQWV